MGSHMSLGAALENVHLQTEALGLNDDIELFPLKGVPELIAAIRFTKSDLAVDKTTISFSEHLYTRHTNRKLGKRQKISGHFYNQLQQIVNKFENVNVYYTENEAELDELSEIIAECDQVRLMNELGHEEFYQEIRWNREEAEKSKDGVELSSVDISPGEIAGFKVAGDWKAVELLSDWDQGNAFKKLSLKAVKSASAIIVFTITDFTLTQLINAGMAVEKAWIFADQEGVSVHPILSPAFFFNRLIHGKGEGLPIHLANKLSLLRKRFLRIFPLDLENEGGQKEVFLMKVAIAEDMGARSLRKNKSEIFYKQ